MAVILVVDNEIIVINVVRTALERTAHTVHTAQTAAEAYRLGEVTERFDVLIVDHWIPPDTGRTIAERLLVKHGKAKVLHISGYPRAHLEEQGWLMSGAGYLGKPFKVKEIQEGVAGLLGAGSGLNSAQAGI